MTDAIKSFIAIMLLVSILGLLIYLPLKELINMMRGKK